MDIFAQVPIGFFDPARLPLALGALALVAAGGLLTGPVAGFVNPAFWALMDVVFGRFGKRLDRVQRKRRDLVLRGLVLAVFGSVFALGGGALAEEGVRLTGFASAGEILAFSLCLSGGTVWVALFRLYKALKTGKVVRGAYYAIARSSRMDLSAADNFTITRFGVGFAAFAFDKGTVAPLFWYLAGGLPLAFLYAGVQALSWRFGRHGFTKGLGLPALKLEWLMGVIPSVWAAFFLALAALFTPTAMMTRAIRGWFAGKGRMGYDQGGAPLTTMAWALDVSLGGPGTDLDGRGIQSGWSGPAKASARLESGHLRRAIYISVLAHILLAAALLGIMIAVGENTYPSAASLSRGAYLASMR